MVLIAYVDYIILSWNDEVEIYAKSHICAYTVTKNFGNLFCFLRIEVSFTFDAICVYQRKFVLDHLQESSMLGARPANTSLDRNDN